MNLFNFFFKDDALEKLAQNHAALFPLGAEQLAKEARMLCALLQNRLDQTTCQDLLIRLKSALTQARGTTERADLHTLLQAAANGDLLPDEIDRVVDHLTGLSGAIYSRNDGLSLATAVKIYTNNAQIGIELEQRWLNEHLGRKYRDWEAQEQALYQQGGHYYDVFVINLSGGQKRTVVFDITNFFPSAVRH